MKEPARRKLPSPGFVIFCLVYILVAAFFVWGMSLPELDRIWTLHHELKTGRLEALDHEDRALLASALARYPALGRALLGGREIGLLTPRRDGWIATPRAVFLRTPEAGMRTLHFQVQTPMDLLPFYIAVRGRGWQRSLEVKAHGELDVPMPGPPEVPEIVEIEVRGSAAEADPSMLGLRVTFPCQEGR